MELISKFLSLFVCQSIFGNITATVGSRERGLTSKLVKSEKSKSSMASSENRDSRSSTFDTARQEAEYKKDKARAKSNFSRSKNKLMSLLEETEQDSCKEILDALRKMDSCSEIATDILISFAEFYIRMDELQKSMGVSNEL